MSTVRPLPHMVMVPVIDWHQALSYVTQHRPGARDRMENHLMDHNDNGLPNDGYVKWFHDWNDATAEVKADFALLCRELRIEVQDVIFRF